MIRAETEQLRVYARLAKRLTVRSLWELDIVNHLHDGLMRAADRMERRAAFAEAERGEAGGPVSSVSVDGAGEESCEG